jgi:hypothetical protein
MFPDLIKNRPEGTRLPKFSESFPPYVETPPPSPPFENFTLPYSISTPPPSPCASSSPSMGLPGSPPSLSFPVYLPSIPLWFQSWETTHHSGNTFPAENRETAPQSAGPVDEGDTPPSGHIKCGWEGCNWWQKPLNSRRWSEHLQSHRVSSPAICEWHVVCGEGKCNEGVRGEGGCGKGVYVKGLYDNGICGEVCGKMVEKADWVNHLRGHEKRYRIHCSECNRAFITEAGLARHMSAKHPPVTSEGASGSGSHPPQGMDDCDDVVMEDQA